MIFINMLSWDEGTLADITITATVSWSHGSHSEHNTGLMSGLSFIASHGVKNKVSPSRQMQTLAFPTERDMWPDHKMQIDPLDILQSDLKPNQLRKGDKNKVHWNGQHTFFLLFKFDCNKKKL